MDLCEKVYLETQNYPKTEIYGLTSQTRRRAVSIPSNIAEGYPQGNKKDFNFCILHLDQELSWKHSF
jgi:four helix bundle protein